MDSKVTQDNDKLSPKFVWIVVAITIVLNLIICSVIYFVSTKEYVIQFKSGTHMIFEVKASSGATLKDALYRTSSDKPGYIFEGWYLDDETFVNEYELPETMPSRNITVYGKWTKDKFDITFDANGGIFPPGAVTTVRLEYDLIIAENISRVSVPTNGDKQFLGWGRTQTSSVPITTENKTMNRVSPRDFTLYAIWGD